MKNIITHTKDTYIEDTYIKYEFNPTTEIILNKVETIADYQLYLTLLPKKNEILTTISRKTIYGTTYIQGKIKNFNSESIELLAKEICLLELEGKLLYPTTCTVDMSTSWYIIEVAENEY